MAEYNSDGTTTYEPGESNDRAVAADPPPEGTGDPDTSRGGVHMPVRPEVRPGRTRARRPRRLARARAPDCTRPRRRACARAADASHRARRGAEAVGR